MKALVATALVSCGIFLAGCTTAGTGYGDAQKGGSDPVSFHWKSTDGGISGAISASLSPERSFSGQFIQTATEVHSDALDHMWHGWAPGWGAWGPGPVNGFVTYYSGHVLANLSDAHGEQMRCRFRLAKPYSGMSGGGSGECQVAGDEKIEATFPPS
jgi:hypothetical protein